MTHIANIYIYDYMALWLYGHMVTWSHTHIFIRPILAMSLCDRKQGKTRSPACSFDAWIICLFFPVSIFYQSGHGEKLEMQVRFIIQGHDLLIMYQ